MTEEAWTRERREAPLLPAVLEMTKLGNWVFELMFMSKSGSFFSNYYYNKKYLSNFFFE